MTALRLGLMLALATVGCAADGNDDGRGAGGGRLGDGDNGTAGGGGGGGFGNADATVPPPPSNAVIVSGGACKTGHYVGQLWGLYNSQAAGGWTPGGIPVSTDPAAVDAAILNMLFPPADGVSPGFEFNLDPSEDTAPCSAGDEFCFDFQVKGGKAKGIANGLFPFEMDLVGDLDCEAGHFEGLIEAGWYEVAIIRYEFEGTIDASFDSSQSAFFDGHWKVTEPTDTTGDAGGEGEWYTAWVDEAKI